MSFLENKIHRQDQEGKPDKVIQTEGLVSEHQHGERGKDRQGDDLLKNF